MSEGSFTSSVPGIYEGLLKLVREAAEEQSKPVSVFPVLLGQFEPKRYIIVGGIKEGPDYEWHAHPLQLEELYQIEGKVTVFSGDSAATNPALAAEVLAQCFALLGECVLGPALANRDAPTFGTSGPSAQIMIPIRASYDSGTDLIAGQPAGYGGVIDWAITFKAIINPAPYLPT